MLDVAVRDPFTMLREEPWNEWPVFPRRWLRRALRNAELLEEDIPIDISKRDGTMIVRVSLPGFTAQEVTCEVKDDFVSIKAEHEESSEEKAEDYYCRERRYGVMSRSFKLPEALDTEHIEAEYRNGVLTLRAPMMADRAAKQIAIKSE